MNFGVGGDVLLLSLNIVCGIHSCLLNVAIVYSLLSSILMYEYNSLYLWVNIQIFSFMNDAIIHILLHFGREHICMHACISAVYIRIRKYKRALHIVTVINTTK